MFPMAAYAHTGDLSIEQWIEYTRRARELGYQGFWVAEESGKEAFTVLAVVGSHVPDIELGLGIASVYARTPTLTAMEVQTLEQVVGPRVVLGIGTGGIGFVERGHGLKIERPIARVRESAHIIRHAGEQWYGKALDIKAVWEQGEHDRATDMVPDDMAALFTLTGEVEQTRSRLDAYQRDGVYPIIYPIPRRGRMFEEYMSAIELIPSILGA